MLRSRLHRVFIVFVIVCSVTGLIFFLNTWPSDKKATPFETHATKNDSAPRTVRSQPDVAEKIKVPPARNNVPVLRQYKECTPYVDVSPRGNNAQFPPTCDAWSSLPYDTLQVGQFDPDAAEQSTIHCVHAEPGHEKWLKCSFHGLYFLSGEWVFYTRDTAVDRVPCLQLSNWDEQMGNLLCPVVHHTAPHIARRMPGTWAFICGAPNDFNFCHRMQDFVFPLHATLQSYLHEHGTGDVNVIVRNCGISPENAQIDLDARLASAFTRATPLLETKIKDGTWFEHVLAGGVHGFTPHYNEYYNWQAFRYVSAPRPPNVQRGAAIRFGEALLEQCGVPSKLANESGRAQFIQTRSFRAQVKGTGSTRIKPDGVSCMYPSGQWSPGNRLVVFLQRRKRRSIKSVGAIVDEIARRINDVDICVVYLERLDYCTKIQIMWESDALISTHGASWALYVVRACGVDGVGYGYLHTCVASTRCAQAQ